MTDIYPGNSPIPVSYTIPTVLHPYRESRTVGLKFYVLCFATELRGKQVYFNEKNWLYYENMKTMQAFWGYVWRDENEVEEAQEKTQAVGHKPTFD